MPFAIEPGSRAPVVVPAAEAKPLPLHGMASGKSPARNDVVSSLPSRWKRIQTWHTLTSARIRPINERTAA